jgi:hypothetical protein
MNCFWRTNERWDKVEEERELQKWLSRTYQSFVSWFSKTRLFPSSLCRENQNCKTISQTYRKISKTNRQEVTIPMVFEISVSSLGMVPEKLMSCFSYPFSCEEEIHTRKRRQWKNKSRLCPIQGYEIACFSISNVTLDWSLEDLFFTGGFLLPIFSWEFLCLSKPLVNNVKTNGLKEIFSYIKILTANSFYLIFSFLLSISHEDLF